MRRGLYALAPLLVDLPPKGSPQSIARGGDLTERAEAAPEENV